ncbi:hephaestin isoform X2 [Amia ocellicauda]|uniref:hephaestin isoform X2 n=1 Tax=Amia ocellicauda TaxID=2972642 RepID=UPI00346429CF
MRRFMLLQILGLVCLLLYVRAATRLYYVGIREIDWDYTPTGRDEVTGHTFSEEADAVKYLSRSSQTIGRVYKKAVYKQYSDASYTNEIVRPAWLGFLGPILRAELGDEIIIHLKNFASRPYSIHPHGVFYNKDSEGAFYPDHTSGNDKLDDGVPPNGTHTYTWSVTVDHAPTPADPNCLTWAYHSHLDAPRDIASGLIGALLTCKKGVVDDVSLTRSDVDQEFLLMFLNVDENLSWYLDENINRFCADPMSVDKEDEGFQDSNQMHSINGYMYGNLPGLEMCAGASVSWHLLGMGSEADIHTAFFHGQSVTVSHRRTDVVSLFPATFVTAEMVPTNVGRWLLSCQVNEHLTAGMEALFDVNECLKTSHTRHIAGKVRKYFIAAKEVLWNYGSSGKDGATGDSLLKENSYSEIFFKHNQERIGGVYWKAKYMEFTDETFSTEKVRTASEQHLGILGPVIKAEVGDTVLVTFLNAASRSYSIQAHGVIYKNDHNRTLDDDGVSGEVASVQPLHNYTYTWTVPEGYGPTLSDPACLTRMYFSAVDPIRDTNSGLVGPLLVCKPGTLKSDSTQNGIDREFFLLFTIFNENLSWYLRQSLLHANINPGDINTEDQEFREANQMFAVNGFLYSNLPALEMCLGSNVSWHLLGLGGEMDIHGAVFQGNTIQINSRRTDSATLLPHTSVTALMQPDNIGTFGVICQTSGHFLAGMKQQYQVSACNSDGVPPAPVLQFKLPSVYYIAADEVEWDYSPDRTWEFGIQHNSTSDSYGEIFVGKEDGLIGSKYKKVVYREYTDGSFTKLKDRTDKEQHLGILGPLIRAEVGDIILIVFKNNGAYKHSLHAHGVQESNGGTIAAAQPGEIVVYRWNIPERSGPGPGDSACITWAYYSMEDPVKDLHSGLIGPLITCRKGTLTPARTRADVDREFSLLFFIFDENQSWYLDQNIAKYTQHDTSEINLEDERFCESNKMHAINGKIYANLHGLAMCERERVDWYLIGMGQDIDMHTVHFHAHSFTFMDGSRHRADVFDLFPATFKTLEMEASNPGTWLLHCHVSDHIHAGMEALYTIYPKPVPHIFNVNSGPEIADDQVNFLGMFLSHEDAELVLSVLLVLGVTLLLTAVILLGTVIVVSRKRRGVNKPPPEALSLNIL